MNFEEFKNTRRKMLTSDYLKENKSWHEHTHKEVFVYLNHEVIEIHPKENGCTKYIASPLDGTIQYHGLELEVAEMFLYDKLVEHGTFM